MLHLAEAAADALAAFDPDLAHEKGVITEARAAEAAGAAPAKPQTEHAEHVAALLRSGLQRPPSWSDPPPPGCDVREVRT